MFRERFWWRYTWWVLICRYKYLSSFLLWIYKHLGRAVRMLCLQRRRSWIKINGFGRSSCLLLFLQWWMRRRILWKWSRLFDKVLLDILICMSGDLCLAPLLNPTIEWGRHHWFEMPQLPRVHSALLLWSDPLFPAISPRFSLIVNQEMHQPIYVLGLIAIDFMKLLLSWCHWFDFIEDKNNNNIRGNDK